jgi:hypothetical protein
MEREFTRVAECSDRIFASPFLPLREANLPGALGRPQYRRSGESPDALPADAARPPVEVRPSDSDALEAATVTKLLAKW